MNHYIITVFAGHDGAVLYDLINGTLPQDEFHFIKHDFDLTTGMFIVHIKTTPEFVTLLVLRYNVDISLKPLTGVQKCLNFIGKVVKRFPKMLGN